MKTAWQKTEQKTQNKSWRRREKEYLYTGEYNSPTYEVRAASKTEVTNAKKWTQEVKLKTLTTEYTDFKI